MSTLLPDSKGQTLKGATILRLPSVILECQSWWKREVILKKDDNGEAVGGIQGEEALSGISVALSYWLFTKTLHIHFFFFNLKMKTAVLSKSARYLMKSQCLMHVIQIQIKDWWHLQHLLQKAYWWGFMSHKQIAHMKANCIRTHCTSIQRLF